MYGGAAINPIRVLTRILAELHDDDGPGHGAGLLRRRAGACPTICARSGTALGFDAAGFLGDVGLSAARGRDRAARALEMIWSRPTCEVNGITGGYTGDGFKTVLPSQARPRSASGWSARRTR